MCAEPVALGVGVSTFAVQSAAEREITYGAALADALGHAWPALLVVVLLGAALAIFVYRRQTALDQGAALGWAIFVFFFGVAGFAGYWWHRRWPIQLACPKCGKLVPRDRDACLACREAFPAPVALSTEIR